MFGTPAYMCPDYCQGCPYDGQSDIFSFGVVLGELLTGKLQQPPAIMLQRTLNDESKLPADSRAGEWPPSCAAAIRALALQCMAEKANRVSSMEFVVKQLRILEAEHCPQTSLEISVQSELLSMYRQQQHTIVADALKLREMRAVAEQREQRRPIRQTS